VNAGDVGFCRRFLATLRELNPQHPEPRNLERWADDVRLMREVDGITLEAMAEMMAWVKRDDFWAANILSPGKLRKQWPQLTAKRAAERRKAGGGAAPAAVAKTCACGCGQQGVKAFEVGGLLWARACYQVEQDRRERAAA
jgi:hypothetical protein